MGIRDCLVSAVEQGAISKEEASALGDEFDERYAQLRASLGDTPAKAKARQELEAALRATALEARRRSALTQAARLKNRAFLQGYRDIKGVHDVFEGAIALLSHYGFRGESSVRGRSEAIVAMAHGKLEDLMWQFRRTKLSGRNRGRVLGRDLVKEMRGEDSGNEMAKGFAASLSSVFEDLRQRFNAAGGAIPKLDNWGMPQLHDRHLIRAAGRAAWKDFIRPRLDPDRMINPLTKAPVGLGGIERALDHVYDQVVSEGWAHKVPSMIASGRGAVATQRQDARFLVFKDAESWLSYADQFGKGDIPQVIFEHINGMAKDIAAMEVLGPNPSAMVEWLKQVVRHEIGKMEAGQPSLANRGKLQQWIGPWIQKAGGKANLDTSLGRYAEHRLDAMWLEMRGRPQVISGLASRIAEARDVAGSAVLGTTSVLAATTDPFVASAARRLASLPQMLMFTDFFKNLARSNRRDIIRSGVVWNDFLHVMQDEARFMQASGSDWSKWLLDRTVTLNGLAALTDARKVTEARAWQAHLADQAEKTFDQLEPRLKQAMAGFGITPGDWDVMRQAVDVNGFVTPAEISSRGGTVNYLDLSAPLSEPEKLAELKALRHRDVAEKLAELVSSWSERSVPTTTPNTRSLFLGKTERGTPTGLLADLFLQLKGFSLSFTALQLEAIGRAGLTDAAGRAWGGAKYGAMMAIPLTIGAGVYIQLRSLLDGKDPEDMTSTKFWTKAVLQGGGFGLIGDFAQASDTRFGQSMLEASAGPGAALIGDTFGLTVGNAMQAYRRAGDLMEGKDKPEKVDLGRDIVKYLQRWTPVLSSHWATRAAYRRIILDQLQWLVDPNADKSFKAQASQLKQHTGQHFYWSPGRPLPQRDPNLGAAAGSRN